MIDWLSNIFAPWQSFYSDSAAVSTGLLAIHLAALLIAGGFAVGADRATLRALALPRIERQAHVHELHALHRPVLFALVLLFASGLLMFAADLEAYVGSIVFWAKMLLITLLLANGARLYSIGERIMEGGDESLWQRLGASARISFSLWVGITVLGAVLSTVG